MYSPLWNFFSRILVNWIHNNLHTDLINYITDSQMHTTNDTIQLTNKLMKQEVKPEGTERYNLHQESIISDFFTESDIYDNYSYASFADWEIEKIPKYNQKKLEFNIEKPETDLKKMDANINVNDNEINDMNNKEVGYASGDLINNDHTTLNTMKLNTSRQTKTMVFILLLKTKYYQGLN